MRMALCILLLSPGLVVAGVFKCVVNGQALYSEHPCGADSQPVQKQIIVVPAQAPKGVGPQVPRGNTAGDSGGAGSTARQDPAPAPANDCQARKQQYLDAQACFNQYRIKGGAVKAEAYDQCPDAKYPAGCPSD